MMTPGAPPGTSESDCDHLPGARAASLILPSKSGVSCSFVQLGSRPSKFSTECIEHRATLGYETLWGYLVRGVNSYG